MAAGPDLMLQAAQSQAMAAWFQAWGSIAAIIAAAGIASWQARGEERLRKSTQRVVARDLSVSIISPMREWGRRAVDWVRTLDSHDGLGVWAMMATFADSEDQLAPPSEVLRYEAHFRDFGAAASVLQDAAIAWHDLLAFHSDVRAYWNAPAEMSEERAKCFDRVAPQLRKYANAVIAACEAVENLRSSGRH